MEEIRKKAIKNTIMNDNRKIATKLVNRWIENKVYSKSELARRLSISNPTLYKRIETGEWKGREMEIIFHLD